ncbi:SDR family NAD(P)-dependent oxidoreductase [Sphingomonas sp. TDK1]|uniref:SDR family NAD(P)-dependent oxidoreductase n=1 Tax=Sphingomonas sp. TDK1 TaxID=453247 RepID=UPI0007D9E769|nr:SDR family NAD(P)-dependent oxidoreductase [Sphingomonas sp. TDK1]OAN66661.1 short-chain dehydrogenase [Sphingomonas sp. TDK1]
MNRFHQRTALVTGAGSGIGQAVVARLLEEGANIIAVDVSEQGLVETADRAGHAGHAARLQTITADVSEEAAVAAMVAEAGLVDAGLDVLVNAAGILRSAHTHQTSLDLWNQILKVNLTSTFLMTRATLPALLRTGRGVVINFSSTSASFAHPYMAAYAASKGGIQAFTHAIAAEYASQGLRAIAVAPGSIESGMTRAPGIPEDGDLSLFAKLTPALGRGFAPPTTVAGLVAALASDDGLFVTGTELRIDGGTHM